MSKIDVYSIAFNFCCISYLLSILSSAYVLKQEVKKLEEKIEHRLKEKVVEVRKG